MEDCRIKQTNVSAAHDIWNKTPDSRESKEERTHRRSKDPILQTKSYEHYKTFHDFEEVMKAVEKKQMPRGELVYDIQRGICKLVKQQQ